MPGADMIGVLPFVGLAGFGVDVGLSRIPSGMDIAVKVGPWAIVGTAMSAKQWARRPRYIGSSQDEWRRGLRCSRRWTLATRRAVADIWQVRRDGMRLSGANRDIGQGGGI